jgi:hypothetical protein
MSNDNNAQGEELKNEPQVEEKQQESNAQESNLGPEVTATAETNEMEEKNKQLYARLKKAEERVKMIEEEEKKREEDELIKKGEVEELLTKYKQENTELQQYRTTVEENTDALNKYLERELDAIPEERRSMIPGDYSVAKKLDYISAHASILKPQSNTVNSVNQDMPQNTNNVLIDEKQKIQNQIAELREKKNKLGRLSDTEGNQLMNLSRELKTLEQNQ